MNMTEESHQRELLHTDKVQGFPPLIQFRNSKHAPIYGEESEEQE